MSIFSRKKNYNFDHAGVTPLQRSAYRRFVEATSLVTVNPNGRHQRAQESRRVLEAARSEIASLIRARVEHLIFTSSTTESDNLALQGVVRAFRMSHPDRIPHMIVSAIEHSAVLATARALEADGQVSLSILPVDHDGLVDPKHLSEALQPETILVSIMYANNEIGVVEPITTLAKVVRAFRKKTGSSYPYFHTDTAQAPLYLPCTLPTLGVDLLTLGSVKVYGPPGAALLAHTANVALAPIVFGGEQEHGMRAGTQNVAAIVGFATALSDAVTKRKTATTYVRALQEYCTAKLRKAFPSCIIHGSLKYRLPNNLNVTIPGFESDFLLHELDQRGILASTKSACLYEKGDRSYVLEALGSYPDEGSIRLSFGAETTEKDIDYLVAALTAAVEKNAPWQAKLQELDSSTIS